MAQRGYIDTCAGYNVVPNECELENAKRTHTSILGAGGDTASNFKGTWVFRLNNDVSTTSEVIKLHDTIVLSEIGKRLGKLFQKKCSLIQKKSQFLSGTRPAIATRAK
jgi:hypothetical protein